MADSEHRYVALAKEAIRHYLATEEILDREPHPDDPAPSGVFVSLHQPPPEGEVDGPLRGCVGSYRARERTLTREIAHSAVAAAFSDPRFPPLAEGEIDELHVTVYLLGDTEPVNDLEDLDPAVDNEGRFLMVRVELDDSPGSLARLAALVAELGANIFHVSHDRRNSGVPLGQAEVHLELETRGPEHIGEILAGLRDAGYGASVLH